MAQGDDSILGLFEAASLQQEAADEAIKELRHFAGTLRVGFDTQLAQAIRATKLQIEEGLAPTYERLVSAERAMKEAEASLKRSSQRVGLRAVLLVAVSAVAVVAAVWFGVRWQVDAVLSMRAEKAQLEAQLAQLDKYGGRLQPHDCSGRPCFEIASGGEFKGAAGQRLFIPKGY